MEEKRLENFIEQLSAEKLDANMLIGTLDVLVNNFSLNKKEIIEKFISLSGREETNLNNVSASCVWALGHTKYVDDRNRMSADICLRLSKGLLFDPVPEVGQRFLSMHKTLQQTTMSIFFQYLDERSKEKEYIGELALKEINELKDERGEKWYVLPLI